MRTYGPAYVASNMLLTPPGLLASYYAPQYLFGQSPSNCLRKLAERLPDWLDLSQRDQVAQLFEYINEQTSLEIEKEVILDIGAAYIIHELFLAPIRVPIYMAFAYHITRAYKRKRVLNLPTLSKTKPAMKSN